MKRNPLGSSHWVLNSDAKFVSGHGSLAEAQRAAKAAGPGHVAIPNRAYRPPRPPKNPRSAPPPFQPDLTDHARPAEDDSGPSLEEVGAGPRGRTWGPAEAGEHERVMDAAARRSAGPGHVSISADDFARAGANGTPELFSAKDWHPDIEPARHAVMNQGVGDAALNYVRGADGREPTGRARPRAATDQGGVFRFVFAPRHSAPPPAPPPTYVVPAPVPGGRRAGAARLRGRGGALRMSEPTLAKGRRAAPPPEPELLVQHNLSSASFLHADKVGGLPAPSLAVAHKDHPLVSAFGDITLVGHPGMVDPKQDRRVGVYGADIYSPRHPKTEHAVVGPALKKLWKEVAPHAAKFGYCVGPEDVAKHVSAKGAKDAVEERELRHVLGAAYLAQKGQVLPELRQPVPRRYPFTNHPDVVAWAQAHPTPRHLEWPDLEELSRVVRRAITDHVAGPEYSPTARRSLVRDMSEGLDDLSPWRADDILRDAEKTGQTERNHAGMRNWVEERLGPHEQEFRDWAAGKLAPLQGAPYIVTYDENSGEKKRRKYSLDAAVRAMTRGQIRGGENFNYGLGTARAMGAPQFRTLQALRAARHKLVSKEDFDRHKDEADREFSSIVTDLAPHHNAPEDFGHTERVANALGESFRHGRLAGALNDYGFRDVPPEKVDRLRDFGRRLLDAPTEYFEAKPKRVVQLNEFRGAVVPENASPQVLAALRRHGLHVETYPAHNLVARKEAVRRLAHAKQLLLAEQDQAALLRKFEELPRKVDLGRVGGVRVWGVDGSWVRAAAPDAGFAEGGHPARQSFVPAGEVWVDVERGELPARLAAVRMVEEYAAVQSSEP